MHRALVPSLISLALLCSSTVQADSGRHFVVAAGGDSSVFVPEDSYAQEHASLGYSGLRFEFEMSGLIAERPELLGGSPLGLRMRAGLGAYF